MFIQSTADITKKIFLVDICVERSFMKYIELISYVNLSDPS